MIMKKKLAIIILAPIAIVLFMAIGGEVVMRLWNWLAPGLFGWRLITFWQALGLLVLCRILFGGWGSHGHDRPRWRRNKWSRMTPEEREKFRATLRESFGGMCGEGGVSKEPA
jgi:hypothetical protein